MPKKDQLQTKLEQLKEIEEDSKFSIETKAYCRIIIERIKKLLKKEQ